MNKVGKILFVGDTVPNRRFEFGGSFKRLCAEHDLRVFNLEGAFSGLREPLFKAGPHLLLEPEFFGPLQECFNVAVLANNHVMDFGVEGLDTTMLQCRKARIAVVGAGLNQDEAFAPLDIGSCRLISVAEHEFGAADKDKAGIAAVDRPVEIYSLIKRGRETGKFVVVIAHGGTELIPVPPPYLRQRYKLWIEYGADLIIGNHPHVVQGCELYKGKSIFYSLGNFVFFNDSFRDCPNALWSIAVSVDIPSNNLRVIPVCSDENNMVDVSTEKHYEDEFARLCSLIQSDDYFELYGRLATELYQSWYRRLSTSNCKDAAVLLHYLRCDAHRNLVQTALSEKISEAESDKQTNLSAKELDSVARSG